MRQDGYNILVHAVKNWKAPRLPTIVCGVWGASGHRGSCMDPVGTVFGRICIRVGVGRMDGGGVGTPERPLVIWIPCALTRLPLKLAVLLTV